MIDLPKLTDTASHDEADVLALRRDLIQAYRQHLRDLQALVNCGGNFASVEQRMIRYRRCIKWLEEN